jgi:hypothetical protein
MELTTMKGEEKWMVDNPGSPILFNSEEYEENPKRRRGRRRKMKAIVAKPKRHRRRKAGRKATRKVGRKATKRSKRRGKRPFTFLKAYRKRRRGFHPFKTPKGTTFFMGPKAKYEENAWKGQSKRHRRAARKGWKRHPRRRGRKRARKAFAFNAEANPGRKHRRRRAHKAFSFNFASNPKHKRYSRRRHYSSNPTMGGFGAKITGGKFYHLPKYSELKSQGPVKSILYGAGGLITTSLIGMGINYGMQQAKITDERIVDAGRIAGELIFGSIVSWGIGKGTKSTVASKTWQTGVYIATGLDIAGTIFKYAQRGFKGIKMGGMIRPPMTTGNIIMGALGMGSIQQAYFEGQIADAIIKTGRVEIVGNEKGHIGLMHPGTGKIILSGPEKQMAPILGAVQKIMIKTGAGDREEDRGLFGEDITIEA